MQAEKENPESNLGKIFQFLSEDYQKVITDSSDFLRHTNNFLELSILDAQNSIADLAQSGGENVESCHQVIKEGLSTLRNLINEIKGET